MKKILIYTMTLFCTGVCFSSVIFAEGDLQGSLTDKIQAIIPTAGSTKKSLNYVDIAKEIQFWIFAFIGIIAVAYIIFIGAKLLWAPGNTEEMTAALKSLTYVVVGLALIPFAYFIIDFIKHIRL